MQQQPSLTLPTPDADSIAHSDACAAYIRDRIADAGGSISFAEFMHYALYAPGLGYYTAGARKFGEEGDFVTAPEISPLFGRVLARQVAAVFNELDAPSIIEFGAGSGALAVEILRTLDEDGALPENYLIVEVSPDLTDRQQRRLQQEVPHIAGRVQWLRQLPERLTGVVVANEVLDALPVERFIRRPRGVRQVAVAVDEIGFRLADDPAPAVVADAVAAIESDLGAPLADGYASEICLAAAEWIRSISGMLERGAGFLFDYGLSRREYYAPDRSGGWLRCHYRHHAHSEPLILTGIQDITAWVDFTAVAEALVECGQEILGYVPQAQFLLNGGVDRELAGFTGLSSTSQLELSKQLKILTLPGEMGENVKCLGFGKGLEQAPSAFAAGDRTHTL